MEEFIVGSCGTLSNIPALVTAETARAHKSARDKILSSIQRQAAYEPSFPFRPFQDLYTQDYYLTQPGAQGRGRPKRRGLLRGGPAFELAAPAVSESGFIASDAHAISYEHWMLQAFSSNLPFPGDDKHSEPANMFPRAKRLSSPRRPEPESGMNY
jgi:hypothetical protein